MLITVSSDAPICRRSVNSLYFISYFQAEQRTTPLCLGTRTLMNGGRTRERNTQKARKRMQKCSPSLGLVYLYYRVLF